MRTKSDIEKEIARLKADERLSYPPASVFSNAPLALMQVSLKERIVALEWVLEGNYWDEDNEAVEHKARHVELHKSLDELIADFIGHTGNLPSETSIRELMQWSYEQTLNPTEDGSLTQSAADGAYICGNCGHAANPKHCATCGLDNPPRGKDEEE